MTSFYRIRMWTVCRSNLSPGNSLRRSIPRATNNETFCPADISRDQSIICGRGQYKTPAESSFCPSFTASG